MCCVQLFADCLPCESVPVFVSDPIDELGPGGSVWGADSGDRLEEFASGGGSLTLNPLAGVIYSNNVGDF